MSFRNITPFSGGMPTFCVYLPGNRPSIQLLHRRFNPVQCVSTLQPMGTCILELPSLPHVFLDLADFLLVHCHETTVRGWTQLEPSLD